MVRLEPLGVDDLRALIDRALADEERGLGKSPPDVPDEVRDKIAREADGDARRALTTLELAARVVGKSKRPVDDAVLAKALGRKTLRYDRAA